MGRDYWKRRISGKNLDYMSTALLSTEPMIQRLAQVTAAKRAADPTLKMTDALAPLGGLGKVTLQGIEAQASILPLNASPATGATRPPPGRARGRST